MPIGTRGIPKHTPSSFTLSTYDHHVRSVSVSKLSDNSEYFLAWSQIYDQQGWVDYNKFKSGSSSIKYLNTKGWNVQLTEAADDSDIRAASYYPKTAPYYWEQSNTLGSYLKQMPITSVHSRGVELSAATGAAYFSIGDIIVDGSPVPFTPLPDHTASAGDSWWETMEIEPASYEDVRPWLVSEPFQLSKDTELGFKEEAILPDAQQLENLIGESGYLRFRANLVDAGTGAVLGTVREVELGSGKAISSGKKSWKVNTDQLPERMVRLRIDVETNVSGLQALIMDHHSDDGAKNKKAGDSLEDAEGLIVDQPTTITSFGLDQNYPNPFNPSTVISYQLPENSLVRLEVFDLLGRSVATLVNERQSTGRYSVTFDASHLASGVYIYRLKAGEFTQSKKLFLIK